MAGEWHGLSYLQLAVDSPPLVACRAVMALKMVSELWIH
jgi:hypothetical protein